MSQTTITLAFEQWKAQQAIDGKAVVLDEFVLANVPNLDIDSPIDRAEQLPAAQYIVHRQAVSATGVVNENAVVYSVTMGAEVGDFEFNWVGLINKATGALAMIVHAPLQSKIKNAEGKQGNVLTRSFLMEYNGAASETQITTPAETWQIDFTARLLGMDERQRLENVDLYGAAAFFGDGFLVTRAASQYSITQGIGYVGGLRCKLPATQNITVTTKPVKVWADVCWKGTLTSVWDVVLKITVADKLANYVQDGVQHYVFAVANIDANGVITDLRPKGTLDGQQGNKDFLRIDKSLSEIAAKGEVVQKNAVKNLGLNQTVDLAGNALQKDKNLLDVPDKGKARVSLELVKQTSLTDATSGALLLNGGWGLGGYTIKDEIDRCGFLSFGAGSAANPNGGAFAHINVAVSGFYTTRLAVSYADAVPTAFLQTIHGDTKNSWVPLLTSDNGLVKENNLNDVSDKATSRRNLGLGSAAVKNVGTSTGNVMEVGARGWAALAPNGATDTVTSVYWGVAGSEFNPDASAGYAHLNIAVSGTYRVRMAIQYSEGKPRVYVQNIGTTYGDWVQFYTTANKPTAADVGAQSDTRLGAEVEVGSASFTTSGNGRYARAPAGHTLTGIVDYNHLKTWLEDIDSILARPIQKQINGTWYTVSQL